MIRKLTIAALMTTAMAFPVLAQETQNTDPSKKGPTSAVGDQVPNMKGDAPKAAPASPSSTTMEKTTPATPAVKPANSASTTMAPSGMKLTDAEAKAWVGKPVYSSDQKKIGEVEAVNRGPNGDVTGLNAGIGGFLGLGETHVTMTSSQFTLAGDRVNANVVSTEAKNLPKVAQ